MNELEERKLDSTVAGTMRRRWMSVPQAAEHTGLSENTIRAAIRAGELRALKAGSRNYKILPDDLDRWAETLVYKPE